MSWRKLADGSGKTKQRNKDLIRTEKWSKSSSCDVFPLRLIRGFTLTFRTFGWRIKFSIFCEFFGKVIAPTCKREWKLLKKPWKNSKRINSFILGFMIRKLQEIMNNSKISVLLLSTPNRNLLVKKNTQRVSSNHIIIATRRSIINFTFFVLGF